MTKGIASLKLSSQALENIEKIHGHYLLPEHPRVKVEIEKNQEKAVRMVSEIKGISVAVDCSSKNNLIGVGASYGAGLNRHLTIGYSHNLSVYFGELYAIQWAVKTLTRTMSMGFPHSSHVTILSDSQAALKALKKPARQSGQWLLREITQNVSDLKAQMEHTISLCWVPSHAKVDLNEKADHAAKTATKEGGIPEIELPLLKTTALKAVIAKLDQEKHQKLAPKVGRFTQSIDHALPGKHTRKLYDKLSREQAATLSQLRTGKNKLNYYLAKAKIVESGICGCGREPESVGHFLLRCPRWATERTSMWRAAGKQSGDLSFLLGGWDPQTQANKSKWQPDMAAVNAAIQFVKDTGRFEEEEQER